MTLNQLRLQNFRSHRHSSFTFSPGSNLILGPNGSGKTNILEAVYLLSVGKSFLSSSLSQLISWSTNFSTIEGQTDSLHLEIRLLKSDHGQHTLRQFFLDHVSKTRKAYFNQFNVVIFHPEDIRLVGGSPSRRRELLDHVFFTSEWQYTSAVSQYRRALAHRNELLDLIRQGQSSPNELFYWNQSLVKNDEIIHLYRQKFINHLNSFFSSHPHPEIRQLKLNYRPSFLTSTKLEQNYSTDLQRGYTQSGSHHDDYSFDNLSFPSDDKNLAFWGSRGQQRLAVLALRLGQIDYLFHTYQNRPVLLLDDIFSELDPEYRHLITQICQDYQTIFTSSEPDTPNLLPQAQILQLL